MFYRTFSVYSEAYYYSHDMARKMDLVDEIIISVYGDTPSKPLVGEFVVYWKVLAKNLVPCLKVYEDAWLALSECNDLIEALAEVDNTHISVDNMKKLLVSLGIVDVTKRTEQ